MNNYVNGFLDDLSSKAPTPGGGGASALAGALGAALGLMVCNLTSGKKKFADVEDELQEKIAELTVLRDRLLSLVDGDAEAFLPLAAAFGLPKGTEEEKEEQNKALQDALSGAIDVPLKIMEAGEETLHILKRLMMISSRIAISDVAVAAEMARACVKGASFNVYINTPMMDDREAADALNEKADALNVSAVLLSKEVGDYVQKVLAS